MIEVISSWYNEILLAPFFLKHWSPMVDLVTILMDEDTNDGSELVIIHGGYGNVTVEYRKNLCDIEEQSFILNRAYNESQADWIIQADADEFIFHDNLREFLKDREEDIFMVRLYQPFRNEKDSDLTPDLPIKGQRKYGDINAVKGQQRRGIKPMIARTGKKIHWMPGLHKIYNRHRFVTSNELLFGQHWVTADPIIAIQRKLARKARNTKNNIEKGLGFHNFTITEEEILAECETHFHDRELPDE